MIPLGVIFPSVKRRELEIMISRPRDQATNCQGRFIAMVQWCHISCNIPKRKTDEDSALAADTHILANNYINTLRSQSRQGLADSGAKALWP